MPAPAVKPRFGPSLPELIGPRLGRLPVWLRLLALTLALGAVVAGAVAYAGRGTSDTLYSASEPVAFNFRHSTLLEQAAPRDREIVRLERPRDDGLFVQSFAVSPLELPRYDGDVGGMLPILAGRFARRAAERHEGFELVEEGRARVEDAVGYSISFRARVGERPLYGRLLLMPTPRPVDEDGVPLTATHQPREGVVIEMLSTPAGGVNSAEQVGSAGVLKKPYRSFRFGEAE
jgi:hypothetical protein